MYTHLRPWLFRLDPERAHALTLSLVRLAGALPGLRNALHSFLVGNVPQSPVEAFGLVFPNPVGLAAGYDKDGLGWHGLAALGFGHIEVGTVTLRPQSGNPRPRLFRLPEYSALINRMGFPGQGAPAVSQRLKAARPYGIVLGVNIGKNKDTPLEKAAQDYLALMEVFSSLADYLAVNVSSPNTVGLRGLQARQALEHLLRPMVQRRRELQAQGAHSAPLLVKLAPDLSDHELNGALDVLMSVGIDGVIATNTTVSRDGITSPLAKEPGGLSGAPLRERSTQMIRAICARTERKLPVIGVGGVMCAADALEKLEAGATLVQVYTGLVYAGPGLVRSILEGLKAY